MSLRFSQLGARQTDSDIARLMTMALQRPDLLSLAAGFTDNATLPLQELTEVAIGLGESGDKRVLQYGSNQGDPILRAILTQRLAEQDRKGAEVYDPELSFVSNGSQQALYLAVQTLCDPGDIILVEQPTYFVFLEMLRGLGVQAVSLPSLANGEIDVPGMEELLAAYAAHGKLDRVKAVYLVSYFANPSGRSVSAEIKDSVLRSLSKYEGRIAIFEDAAYRELYYEQAHSANSLLADETEKDGVPVFYTTTLTKSFATGLKVGYAYCNHREWLARMLAVKGQQDFGTSNYLQALFVRTLQSGLFDRHLGRIRKSYAEKMASLDRCLAGNLRSLGWDWERPEGGLYLWVSAPVEVRTGFDSVFYGDALDQGVLYVPGQLCHAENGCQNKARLSFGVLQNDELQEAGQRFAKAAAVHKR